MNYPFLTRASFSSQIQRLTPLSQGVFNGAKNWSLPLNTFIEQLIHSYKLKNKKKKCKNKLNEDEVGCVYILHGCD